MAGRLSVTDADVKKFCSSQREGAGREFESSEGFLMPAQRRPSEAPSLVFSEVSSRGTELEDLEELSECESERQGEKEDKVVLRKRDGETKRWGKVFVEPVVVADVSVDEVA